MALPKIVKDIDARVKDTGDTMTGNLIVEKGDYPSFNADNTTTGARANFQSWENSAVVQSQNVAGDTNNRRGLFLKNSNAVSSVANALTLRDWVNGTYTEYKLYGTHNKPSLSDLGAAPSTHDHNSLYLPLTGGTITSNAGDTSLYLQSNSTSSWVGFKNSSGTSLGFLGVKADKTPAFYLDQAYPLLHSGNYNAYAPTLTGGGASGTWGIGISGNAATATKLANSRTIFSHPFDGSANIAGQPLVYGWYTSAANSRYSSSGIQIRENGLVGNTQTDAGYAPSIGFHWSGKVGGSMYYFTDQNFYFKKQDGTTRASLDANLIGNASTATKLATARSISLGGNYNGSANFDGSGNITINAYNYSCSVNSGNTTNYPWHRIATSGVCTGSWTDKEMIIMVRHYYNGGGVGVAKIGLRTNNVTNGDASSANAYWMYRYNIGCENLGIGLRKTAGNTLADLYYKVTGGWSRCEVYQLQGGRAWTLINSSEASDTTTSDKKGSTEVYTSISDGGSKLGAGYTDIIYAVDGATRPSSSGTSGLTSGSSSLGTGNIYYQYE